MKRTSTGANPRAPSSSVVPAAVHVVTERDFQQQIVEFAQLMGWAVFRVHDSRRSPSGWPDLALCRGPTLLFLECKTERGRVRPEQKAWIERLKAVRFVEAAICRPQNRPEIEDLLKRAVR